MSVLGKRLRQARLKKGLSQERLGVLAGIDEMSANTRMNQYERGVHTPGYPTVERFAEVLGVPTEFFYAKKDETAQLLLGFHKLNAKNKARVLSMVKELAGELADDHVVSARKARIAEARAQKRRKRVPVD